MKKQITTLVILVLILLSFSKSFAYLIDTGTPTSDWATMLNYPHQSESALAGQFVLNNSYNINSITTFLRPDYSSGSLPLSIYGNSNVTYHNTLYDVPNVNSQFYSNTFNVQGKNLVGGNWTPDWYGPTDVNLSLGPGKYWVAYGAGGNDTWVGGLVLDAPYPLPNYANSVNSIDYFPWQALTTPYYWSSLFGLRIDGESSALPAIADIPVDPQARIIEGVQADNKTFSWPVFYNLSFANSQLSVDLDIQLVGYNPGDTLKNLWERGIEDN